MDEKEARAIFQEVLDRIPADAKVVIGWLDGELPSLETYADPDGLNRGSYEEGAVHFNLLAPANTRDNTVWCLAHELAHAYLSKIAGAASNWVFFEVSQVIPGAVDERTGAATRLMDEELRAVSGYTPAERPDLHRSNERLADAVALAWGFGREAAASFVESRDNKRRQESYLNPVP